MVKSCYIMGCQRGQSYSSSGVSFHQFPRSQKELKRWLNAIPVTRKVSRNSMVCSLHFTSDDFYETAFCKKLKPNAVPSIFPLCVEQNLETESLLVCRICLGTDLKLLPISKYDLAQTYEHVMGFPINENDNLPQYMCVECAQRLINCKEFQSKCFKSRTLLLDLISDNNNITLESIRSIDRDSNNLSSSLSLTVLDPVSTIHFEYNEKEVQSNEDIDNITLDIKSDNESDISAEYLLEEEYLEEEFEDVLNDDKIDVNENEDKEKKDLHDQDEGIDDDETDWDENDCDKDSVDDTSRLESPQKELKPHIRKRKTYGPTLYPKLFKVTKLTFEEQLEELKKKQESKKFKNTIFKCNKCYVGFVIEESYKSHMVRHSELHGDFECQVCKLRFKHRQELNCHGYKSHHTRYDCKKCSFTTMFRQSAMCHQGWHAGAKYQCPHCPIVFEIRSSLYNHLRKKHQVNFFCEFCGYPFVSNRGIERHKKIYHSIDNKDVPEDGPLCETCKVRFASGKAYMTHASICSKRFQPTIFRARKRVQTGQSRKLGLKKLLCEECGDEFLGARAYIKHFRETHVDQYEDFLRLKSTSTKLSQEKENILQKEMVHLPCEQCGVELVGSFAYDRHFKEEHPGMNRTLYPFANFMCEVCGKFFPNTTLLSVHSLRHSGTRPFSCDICGKGFFTKAALAKHMGVHQRSYVCDHCGSFNTTLLSVHSLQHSGTRPYSCDVCSKGFFTKAALAKHTGVHERSYVCDHCSKAYASHCSLQRHVYRAHDESRPHICEVCGKGFKERCHKREHIRYVHLKKPWPKRNKNKCNDTKVVLESSTKNLRVISAPSRCKKT